MTTPKTGMFVSNASDLEAFKKIASGEANAERPHIAVPLYTPITEIPADKYDNVRTDLLEKGFSPIAAAKGLLCIDEEKATLHMTLCWSPRDKMYMTYDSESDKTDCAVLMDGDGLRYGKPEELSKDEAVKQWLAGFLNWNADHPGLYELGYGVLV